MEKPMQDGKLIIHFIPTDGVDGHDLEIDFELMNNLNCNGPGGIEISYEDRTIVYVWDTIKSYELIYNSPMYEAAMLEFRANCEHVWDTKHHPVMPIVGCVRHCDICGTTEAGFEHNDCTVGS